MAQAPLNEPLPLKDPPLHAPLLLHPQPGCGASIKLPKRISRSPQQRPPSSQCRRCATAAVSIIVAHRNVYNLISRKLIAAFADRPTLKAASSHQTGRWDLREAQEQMATEMGNIHKSEQHPSDSLLCSSSVQV